VTQESFLHESNLFPVLIPGPRLNPLPATLIHVIEHFFPVQIVLLVKHALCRKFSYNCRFVQPPVFWAMVEYIPLQKQLVVIFLPVYMLKVDIIFEIVINTHVAFIAA